MGFLDINTGDGISQPGTEKFRRAGQRDPNDLNVAAPSRHRDQSTHPFKGLDRSIEVGYTNNHMIELQSGLS